MTNVKKHLFGTFQGQDVEVFTLANHNGMSIEIMTYGATITSIKVPSKSGRVDDVVCGFDHFSDYFGDEYKANSPYFGCTVGRYAARVKEGIFKLDTHDVIVAKNDGANHLHGGVTGFDKRLWQAGVVSVDGVSGVKMSLFSADGDQGYPGDLEASVTFLLTHDNKLRINYDATASQTTPLSLTNHSYFNLSGFKHDIKDHKVEIAASRFLVPDETNVPIGDIAEVDEWTDFRGLKSLRPAFDQLENGFEHFYLFDDSSHQLKTVATVSEPDSGRTMSVKTTEPGMLFYTGFYTSDRLQRSVDVKFGQFRGLCFETSKYPNGPNIPGAPRSVLAVGDNYSETTEFQFNW